MTQANVKKSLREGVREKGGLEHITHETWKREHREKKGGEGCCLVLVVRGKLEYESRKHAGLRKGEKILLGFSADGRVGG